MFSWEALLHFHFLRPWWLLGVLPVGLLILIQLQRRDLLAQWRPVIAPHLLSNMIVSGGRIRWFEPVFIMGVTAILLFTAMAGPSWEKKSSPFAEDSAALIIAMDLSQSMDQSDIPPSRLQRAKQKVSDLLALRGDAYTALVAYAGTAHTVTPLSNDRRVIGHFLDAMQSNMMPRPGKAPQAVLPVIDKILKNTRSPATLLLLGDGVTDAAIESYQQYFATSPHQLLILGLGLTQDQLDEQAVEGYSSAIVALQDSQLQNLADASGGHYQAMSVDKSDVAAIYRRINNHYQLAEDDARPWLDAGYWLVFPIMLSFLLWFRKGWTLQW